MKGVIKRRDNVPSKKISGETMLLNVSDGDYYGLNEAGSYIWKLLDGTRTKDKIIEAVQKKFSIGRDRAQAHVSDFLKELKKNKLIELSSPQK